MITSIQFKAFFPEFANYDEGLIQAGILVTDALNCGFTGLTGSVQALACGLALASWLISNSNRANTIGTGTTLTPGMTGSQLKRMKSYDDEVEYFENKTSSSDGENNPYQRALNQLIQDNYEGGIAVCSDITDYKVVLNSYLASHYGGAPFIY